MRNISVVFAYGATILVIIALPFVASAEELTNNSLQMKEQDIDLLSGNTSFESSDIIETSTLDTRPTLNLTCPEEPIQNALQRTALEAVSARSNENIDDFMIVDDFDQEYPLTKQSVSHYKVLNKKSGEVIGIHLYPNATEADAKHVGETEMSEFRHRYGKLEPELHDKLQVMGPDEMVSTLIWLEEPKEVTRLPDYEITQDQRNLTLAAQREQYATAEKPLIDALTVKNCTIKYSSWYAPIVFADVHANLIKEIESRSDVVSISLSKEMRPQLNKATKTIKAPNVWNKGISGSGIKVAVVEEGAVDPYNPYLGVSSYFRPASSGILSHPTMVAGVVRSSNWPYVGVANRTQLLSANAVSFNDEHIIPAADWAISQSTNILIAAFGENSELQLRPIDRYFDHVVWNHQVTVALPAGNQRVGNHNVHSPGLSYNTITVGAFDDKDTQQLPDDEMAWYSCYIDPPNRQKPEVVAVGGQKEFSSFYTTVNRSPWISNTDPTDGGKIEGTSFAAPAVAGEAALLMHRKSNLKVWPEAVKAIIMASAIHNLEGEARLSDYDGAGGINCGKADAVANNMWWLGEIRSQTLNPWQYSIPNVQSGQRVRFVICWDAHANDIPNYLYPDNRRISDLDLAIKDPTNDPVTNSASSGNNYEIVDFIASETGTYTAEIDPYDFWTPYERIGIAYWI